MFLAQLSSSASKFHLNVDSCQLSSVNVVSGNVILWSVGIGSVSIQDSYLAAPTTSVRFGNDAQHRMGIFSSRFYAKNPGTNTGHILTRNSGSNPWFAMGNNIFYGAGSAGASFAAWHDGGATPGCLCDVIGGNMSTHWAFGPNGTGLEPQNNTAGFGSIFGENISLLDPTSYFR
jgi:hypothetical protein